jgi:hypothetical protein
MSAAAEDTVDEAPRLPDRWDTLSTLSAQPSNPTLQSVWTLVKSQSLPCPHGITFISRLRARYKRKTVQREWSRVYSRTELWWAENNVLEVEVEAAASGADSLTAAVGEVAEVVAQAEDVDLVMRQ